MCYFRIIYITYNVVIDYSVCYISGVWWFTKLSAYHLHFDTWFYLKILGTFLSRSLSETLVTNVYKLKCWLVYLFSLHWAVRLFTVLVLVWGYEPRRQGGPWFQWIVFIELKVSPSFSDVTGSWQGLWKIPWGSVEHITDKIHRPSKISYPFRVTSVFICNG